MNILLADNHELLLQSLEQLIGENKLADRIFKAGNGTEAWQLIKSKHPDLVISDYKMDGLNGLELLTRLKKENLPAGFLVISMVDEPVVINALMQNGANGFISKDCDRRETLQGIKAVIAGQQFMCSTTKRILKSNRTNPPQRPFFSLRELEILKLIYAEKKNQEIAKHLSIAVSTVETHKKNLLKKLHVKSTVGLVKYVVENGFLP
jgi:DNA-binding NarL/FixJ family response regulator